MDVRDPRSLKEAAWRAPLAHEEPLKLRGILACARAALILEIGPNAAIDLQAVGISTIPALPLVVKAHHLRPSRQGETVSRKLPVHYLELLEAIVVPAVSRRTIDFGIWEDSGELARSHQFHYLPS